MKKPWLLLRAIGAILLAPMLAASPTPTPTPNYLGNATSLEPGMPYAVPTAASTPGAPIICTLTCYDLTSAQSCQADPTNAQGFLVAIGDTVEFYISANNGSTLPTSMSFLIDHVPHTLPTTGPLSFTADVAKVWLIGLNSVVTTGYVANPLQVRAQ